MMLAERRIKNITNGVSISPVAEELSAIHGSGCAAAIWHRTPTSDFQSWIDDLQPQYLPKARVILPITSVRDAVTQICDVCGTPNCQQREVLVDDVSAMTTIFSDIVPTSHMQLRFDIVSDNACRKFHTDAVTARLVCTYRGLGTQYGISADGSEPERVFTVPTGSAMVLRGKLWPEEPKSGLLHRSPPIEGTGETRLVLVLDPVHETDGRLNSSSIH